MQRLNELDYKLMHSLVGYKRFFFIHLPLPMLQRLEKDDFESHWEIVPWFYTSDLEGNKEIWVSLTVC